MEINCRENVSQIMLLSIGALHFFWQQFSMDSLQGDCSFTREERRIKKAARAATAITANRMVILPLMALVF
jgi:hypothetical protein